MMTRRDVLLAPPQLISAIRLILMAIFAIFIFRYPLFAIACAGTSEILDMFDGYLAKKTNSITRFGSAVDMMLDRLMVLLGECVLLIVYPDYYLVFIVIILLDFFSHMSMIYLATFMAEKNHKKNMRQRNPILKHYYAENGFLLVFLITCHDLFFASLMVYAFFPLFFLKVVLAIFALPAFCKILIHLIQLIVACQLIIDEDCR